MAQAPAAALQWGRADLGRQSVAHLMWERTAHRPLAAEGRRPAWWRAEHPALAERLPWALPARLAQQRRWQAEEPALAWTQAAQPPHLLVLTGQRRLQVLSVRPAQGPWSRPPTGQQQQPQAAQPRPWRRLPLLEKPCWHLHQHLQVVLRQPSRQPLCQQQARMTTVRQGLMPCPLALRASHPA